MLGNNKKSIGFDNSLYNNKGGLSSAALLWKANIIANGGTIPDATLQIFDTNFFIPATANGNILNQLDRLNIYCGLNGYEIAARTNIIKAAHYVTPVSSPTFDNNGYKSSGTSYLNLNYNANTQGVKYLLNSASIGYFVKNPTYTTQYRSIGSSDGISLRADGQRDNVGDNFFLNSNIGVINTLKPSGKVFSSAYRTNNQDINVLTNTTNVTSAAASVNIPNYIAYELCLNFGGTALSPFDTISHMASFHGSGNLDLPNLRIILNNLFTALGI
jgi:hypothetical protein